MSGTPAFDAVTLEVLWTRLISIVDEAAAALVRTSFSTVVRESHDFSCVLTDAGGQSLVQATDSIPSFIGTLPKTVRHFLSLFPAGALVPGDVLVTNDPWLGTGHLPDITVVKPIFRQGERVGFAASTAHAPDIGGKMRSPEPREVFEEGLQIPPMKLIAAGSPDETLLSLLRRNVRTPELTLGDLWAQVTALDLMEKRLLILMDEYRLASLAALAAEIQGRSERAMREAIRALPDGTYRAALETDGLGRPLTLALALTIRGDEVLMDFAGTSPQVERAINLPMCYTFAMSAYGMKCVAAPEVPNNEGALRPIRVEAPAGCLVNPQHPAAVGSRALTGHFIPSLLLAALAPVVPDRVMAGAGSPLWSINQSGADRTGRTFANLFFFNGGMGGHPHRDGQSCLSWPSNISSTPTEVIEQLAPLRVHHRRLLPGSGGAGQFRGGLGQEILLESIHEGPTAISFLAERTRVPAPGAGGGEPGATGEVRINGAPVDAKRIHVLNPGDRVLLRTPGGGGYGPPERRDPAALQRDRDQEYA
ncbi:MAG: hydantoinase B/oxoprolinase family protein [Candidatus Lambdaproteobacteria bacterium]|nr:hydantoinase B/oxoprolinase family protein [Candidatus Lambdaproteobacteria bacterium]